MPRRNANASRPPGMPGVSRNAGSLDEVDRNPTPTSQRRLDKETKDRDKRSRQRQRKGEGQ